MNPETTALDNRVQNSTQCCENIENGPILALEGTALEA
jgi:hypothetical protein